MRSMPKIKVGILPSLFSREANMSDFENKVYRWVMNHIRSNVSAPEIKADAGAPVPDDVV